MVCLGLCAIEKLGLCDNLNMILFGLVCGFDGVVWACTLSFGGEFICSCVTFHTDSVAVFLMDEKCNYLGLSELLAFTICLGLCAKNNWACVTI